MNLTVILAIVAMLLLAAAIAYAIVTIARHDDLSTIEKVLWIVVVIVFPLIGSIVWFVTGPHPFGIRIGSAEHH